MQTSGSIAQLRLLSIKNDFLWTPHHDDTFVKAKVSLTMAPIYPFFDLSKPTQLCTDTSKQGLEVDAYSNQEMSIAEIWAHTSDNTGNTHLDHLCKIAKQDA